MTMEQHRRLTHLERRFDTLEQARIADRQALVAALVKANEKIIELQTLVAALIANTAEEVKL